MELSEAAKEKRREYARQYYARNPEKRKKWINDYWERKAKRAQEEKAGKTEKDAKFWIAHMCVVNELKDSSKGLFPVKEFVSMCLFMGFTKEYANNIYKFIFANNYFQFRDGEYAWCYVSGGAHNDWLDDYFVLPFGTYSTKEYVEFEKAYDIFADKDGEQNA